MHYCPFANRAVGHRAMCGVDLDEGVEFSLTTLSKHNPTLELCSAAYPSE